MTIHLTQEKKGERVCLITATLASDKVKISSVAQVNGYIISHFPAAKYGPFYYRNLEKDKTTALSGDKGNFVASLKISSRAKRELNWWLENVICSFKNILPTPIVL